MTEILICGKTELITEDALEKLAEECRVAVAGKISWEPTGKRIFPSITHLQIRNSSISYLMCIVFGRFFTLAAMQTAGTVCLESFSSWNR